MRKKGRKEVRIRDVVSSEFMMSRKSAGNLRVGSFATLEIGERVITATVLYL